MAKLQLVDFESRNKDEHLLSRELIALNILTVPPFCKRELAVKSVHDRGNNSFLGTRGGVAKNRISLTICPFIIFGKKRLFTTSWNVTL